MKVLVTGVGGQLGHDVMNELAGRGIDCFMMPSPRTIGFNVKLTF